MSNDGARKSLEEIVKRLQEMKSIINQNSFQTMNELAKSISKINIPSPDYINKISPIMQEVANYTSHFSNIDLNGLSSFAKTMSELYNSNFFTDSLIMSIKQNQSRLAELAHSLSSSFNYPTEIFDVSNFPKVEMLSDMSIKYDNIILSQGEVCQEFESQMEELKKRPKALYDKFENVKKKFWLVLFILNLIMFIPRIPATYEFYKDMIPQIEDLFYNVTDYCYIIKERAFLRENPNSKSGVICTLLYDTKLEVIEVIPRWLKVRYIDESDVEHIGWISKISVEIE